MSFMAQLHNEVSRCSLPHSTPVGENEAGAFVGLIIDLHSFYRHQIIHWPLPGTFHFCNQFQEKRSNDYIECNVILGQLVRLVKTKKYFNNYGMD